MNSYTVYVIPINIPHPITMLILDNFLKVSYCIFYLVVLCLVGDRYYLELLKRERFLSRVFTVAESISGVG